MLRNTLMVLVVVFSQYTAYSQLKGRVIELGEAKDTLAVPGAILTWKNSNSGVSTNTDGRFELPFALGNHTLLITSVGYENKEIQVKDSTAFMLILLKSSTLLNEIEVVYYTSGTEISYLNPIKTEILNERSLMKAAG